MSERLDKLLSVKSIVTLILTVVFAYLAATASVSSDQFVSIFTVIISFYFGTQYQKTTQSS